ncbi:serine/threonine-protein kinase ATM isoform X2 [Aedes aegypti]|uniref:Serine/threonine-protein kinase ATM n=2 Tax=Aedes aegypti TaxID=7159 RepID=A0A903V012_AEDAE|nr:serine/threonine-protein kinase ATM isoform X2 [Aedes aegypti]
MSSLSTLDRDLCGILAEMRSDKITQRQKAFEKLELILVNREEDILRYMAEQKFDTNWHDLLEAAHHGAQKQNRKMVEPNASSGAESKSYIYIKVIQKVVDMAMNRTRPELKFSELIKRSIDVLEDTSMLQYFGVCYLQVLHKHVLSSKWDLTVVTYDEWTSILDRCFDLYEDGRVAKQNVVSCLSLAIRKSLENCSVQCYFVKFLDRLARMINGSDRGKMQNELLRIGYLCALSLAVDYRYEVCNFTEQISQRVVKAYEARMDEEMKSVLFKMMHLTVVVHSPEKSFSEWRSNQNLLYAVNKTEYFKCLRNFYFIIGSELKAHASASYSSNGREVAFVEGFINLATRLCYVMFWNDDVWKQTEAEDEISVKRIKRSNKLQGLMDLVDENSTQPNWRWLIILTEIIKRCPEVLGEDDYQPLLNLLSVVQPKLSQHPQLEALRSCCSALLRFEKSDAFVKSTIINSEFCLEQWHKIIEGSFRCCTSNNKSASDHHLILQLLISNHKYPSIAFLSGILQAFYTYSIERTNTNVGTIQTILNVVPLEAIGNVQEVVEKLLNYLFPKTRETLAKGILHNKEMLDMRLLAKISVLCSVTKHHKGNDDDLTDEVEGSFHIPENKYEEVDETIRKIEEDILLKSAEKLLVVRSIQQKSSETLDTDVFYNIHEHNFEMLCTSLNFEKHTLPAENDALGKGLNNIIGDVELYLAILNDLLQHNALGRDSFEKCLITKKITFKVQEMEMGFDRLRTLTPVELGEMSSRLLTIFQGPYDERINEMLKASNFTSMLKWMFKNIRTAPERNSKTIEALKASDLNREQSNQHNLLLIVAHYMKYNGVNTDDVKVFLDQIDFNVDSSIDLFHIFGVCKVLLKQRSTFFCAEWILTYIKDICRTHHTNNAMTETIVDLFSDLVIFVSPHDSLFNDTNTVLLSFIRKANKRNYSVGLQRKIYDQVKYLIKAYPDYYESHEPIYVRMISLIESPHFAIKICALENLLYLFDDTWAFTIDTVTADFYRFQLKLYKSVAFEMDDLLRKDEKENLMSAHLQLICGTICKSYCLRKRATLNLVEQACLSNLTQHKVHTIAKLLKTAMSIDTAGLIEEYMEDILDMWISKGYKLASFPWYFTNCGSLDEFIKKYQFDVAYAIVSNRPADLAQYCGIIKRTQAEVMKAISTRCFAFLIPMLAGCDNMSEIYTQIANRMHPIITNHMDMRQLSFQNSSGLCVLQWIVAQLQDEALMTELFGREVLVVEDKCVLNRENFEKCLDHLKPLSAKQPLLTYLCSKYPATVEQLILHLKLKIFQSDVAEQKMILFFQYSAVIDHLVDYFCQHRTTDLKEFLARDICYFLSNTMVCSKSLQLPVLNCLSKFLLQIVPTCAEYVRPHLNILVSSLIAVYDQNPSGKVITKSLKILELIVVEHQALFGDAIKKLNYFPEHDDFKDLRETLEKLKESQFQLSLAEDIIRIVQLPQRKYGELITLYNLLASNKSELRDVCAELEASNGFSESCANNAVLRLINTLLNEIQSSCNEKHTVAALRCLGEIGPVDLCTMLLKSDVQTEIYTNLKNTESTVEQFVRVILLQLNDLLVTKDMSVVEKTTQVCYHLLQNRDYRKLAATLRTLYPYMALVENNAPIFVRPSDNTKLGSLCAIIDTATSYESFVLTLSTTLLESLQDMVIKGLTEVEINFAAKMIPMLVQIILSFKDAGLNYDIGNFVNNFFLKFADKLTPVGCMSKSTETIHLMLTIVECIRMNNQNHSKHTINLNWLQIAEASLHCQAYFKAILYGELWCMTQRDEGVESDVISRNPQLMSIMKTAHLSVGIVDAAKAFLDPIASRSEYYQLERRFHQSLLYYDVASSSKSTFERSAYVQTLKASSFYGLANTVANSESMDFECAWRLADWNIALDDRANQGKQNVDWQHVFEKQHYKALKCLELKDEIATESAVLEARKALAEMLKVGSMESTQNIYPYLSKLRQLQQIEDFMNVQFYRVIDGETELLQKWDQQDTLPYSDFSYMEANLTQRIAILKTARVRAMRKWVPDALNQTLFHLIHEARISGHFDVATANICAMSQQTLSETVKALLMLEDAQLNWANGDKFLSKRLVNEVVAGGKCKDIMVNAAAYRIYGTFLAETHAEDVHNLYKKFFKHSQTLVEEGLRHASQHDKGTAIDYQRKCLDSDRNFVILHTVAKYADREFVRLKKHFTSSEFKSKKMNLEHMKAELIMLESEQAKLKESDREKMTNLRRAKISTKQNATRDEESINTMMSNMEDYLKLALFYYSAYTRKTSIESDLAVFRIVALWLGNHSEKIADTVKESLKVIPTFKFVPVLPQLAPRLDNHKEGVGRMVWETLERCAVDHPHHTLPHILAQVHAFADVERKDVPKDDERLLGAQSLYHKLLKNKKISAIVDQTTDMSLALIEMANKILGTAKGFSDYKMTAKDALRKCQGLDKVHCPTVELKVQESGDYNEIIGVHKWDDLIHGVGGINAPKKLVCHCSDGHNRIQLLKGRDDMRQDAVMQQVFCILNVLLRNDKEAGKQKLAVRTYKVVPLSKQSGILEWCSNTIPIGSWLIPAHSRYRPKDLTALDARKAFAELAKSSLRTKQEKFLKICQQLSPVFQHFFLERFLTSGMWFERRLAYTKSVAVSSIIGYILGIGDRHVQNILVDEKTAEVIHIDFGIAFELGKNLPTPETIPFRLTRDIVAGMGISGIEGVFKKSCEKTLEILRNNHAPIMTILEVLLYDPLYTWNVLANKKAARKQISELYGGEGGQDARSEVVNISAERALLRVSDKLNGKEDEKFTSVEGQVERLIFTASSNLNLCQLFQGWQPYL